MEFYFRPRYDSDNELYYQIDGYKNKTKSFRMILRKDGADGFEKRTWQISSDANISDELWEMEIDFNDLIEGGF